MKLSGKRTQFPVPSEKPDAFIDLAPTGQVIGSSNRETLRFDTEAHIFIMCAFFYF